MSGEVYAVDRWSFGDGVSFDYGGRYARYDYLSDPGQFSPHASLTLEPRKGTRLTTSSRRRCWLRVPRSSWRPALQAPGFRPSGRFRRSPEVSCRSNGRGLSTCFWNTSSRTPTWLACAASSRPLATSQSQFSESTRRLARRSVGHYYVASAGDVDADGWGFRFGTAPDKRVRTSVEYSIVRGDWESRGDLGGARPWVASLARPELESIHDLTASFATDIPVTATRVFVLYKVNTGFARARTHLTDAGTDGRFDVQLNQALPFGLGSTNGRCWSASGTCSAIRMSRHRSTTSSSSSVLPKRVVGGFLVRF